MVAVWNGVLIVAGGNGKNTVEILELGAANFVSGPPMNVVRTRAVAGVIGEGGYST